MPEASIEFMSNRMYNPGEFGPFEADIDDDITHVSLWIDRSSWDETHPDPLLSWEAWRSEDDGQTWFYVGYSSTHGGIIISDTGLEYVNSKWTWTLPSATTRKLRAIITVHRRTRLQATVDFLIR